MAMSLELRVNHLINLEYSLIVSLIGEYLWLQLTNYTHETYALSIKYPKLQASGYCPLLLNGVLILYNYP